MLTIQALMHIEGNNQIGGPIWNYTTGTLDISAKGLKLDCIIQPNCWNVHIHASYKTTGT